MTSPHPTSASPRPPAPRSTTPPRCGTWPPSTTWRSPEVAHRVNVDGTATSSTSARPSPPEAAQYVSTCYVSGRYDGEFGEDVLDQGSPSATTTRSTKVRRRAAGPATRWPTGCRPRSTARASSWATPRRARPEVRRLALHRRVPQAPARPGRGGPAGRGPRRGPRLPGPARLRRRRDGRAVGPDRSVGGPTPDRPQPADRARGRRRVLPHAWASASCGCRPRSARPTP